MKSAPAQPLIVGLYEAKPNKMFTEEQRAAVRFLRYSQAVPCAECGRRSKTHWTVLYSFEAQSLGMLIPKRSGTVHMPLAPVCRAHILVLAAWAPPPRPAQPPKAKQASERA